ncbi:MAG: dihydropteroate synthase [Marinoscillum sp.]
MDKSNTLISHKTINVNGSLVDLSKPKVMGILNITPDSFFSGSRHQTLADILLKADQMISEGACFLDVGGYSSRPGAQDISTAEEVSRVTAPIEAIKKRFPEVIVSIDTFRSAVAKAAVDSGANMVNDISAGNLDSQMIPEVGKMRVPYIAMHMRGTPQTMKDQTSYDDLLKELTIYFSERIAVGHKAGINDLIIDPGFGFAKTVEQNFYLLNHVEYLKNLGLPILIGVSRKSMVYKSLNIEAEDALNGTTVLNTVALLKGASILRVHDVKEAIEAVDLVNQLTI